VNRVHPSSDPQYIVNLLLLQQLTESAVVSQLVDVYFQKYNSSYPILHESTFRERYQTLGHKPNKSNFQITFYMVLAIGQWLLSSGSDEIQRPYYGVARSLFTVQMLEAGTLGTVQALLLMGNYLQKMDRPNTGYNLIGIAHRMAIGLGLYREVPSRTQNDIVAHERRRQVFWTLYCFDSGFSITTGRPTTISDIFIDAHLPRNIDDRQCTVTSNVPNEVDYPTTYSAIIAQAKVAIIANEIHNGLMSKRILPAEIDPSFAAKIETKLEDWRNSLPGYFLSEIIPDWFRGPRSILFWKEQNLRILLWQAIERNPIIWPGKEESRLRCGTVAIECVNSVTSFCHSHSALIHPGISWYATYFLFQATLVLLHYELQDAKQSQLSPVSPHENNPRLQALSQARECLEYLGGNNKSAIRCLAVLDRISKAVSSPIFIQSPANPQSGAQQLSMESSYHAEGWTTSDTNLQDGPSPETAAIFGNHWLNTADPSLNMFLGDGAMQPLFHDFDGFPATMEQNSFDYVNYNTYDSTFL
jgi:transcriptional regulatory protein GAL4